MIRISRRYARALFDLSAERGETLLVSDDWQKLDRLLLSEQQTRNFLESQVSEPDDVSKALALIGEQLKFCRTTCEFLALLAHKRRFGLLTRIRDIFYAFADQAEGIVRAEITTARPLAEEVRNSLLDTLSSKVRKKIMFTEKVDPSLLGGMVIHMGSFRIDASLQSRIQQIQDVLKRRERKNGA